MAISKKDIQKVRDRIENSTKDLSNTQSNEFVRKSITIDKRTLAKIEAFQNKTGLDFSSSIRFIANEYLDTR
jgi:hypothetical protein